MGVEIAFQTALYARLNGQIVGAGKPTLGVYDVAPQAANGATGYPFVTIGETVWTLDDTDTSLNFQAVARIGTWSSTGTNEQALTIQGQIYDALHKHALSVTGWNCYSLLREDSFLMREADGIFHGVCEYRALLQAS